MSDKTDEKPWYEKPIQCPDVRGNWAANRVRNGENGSGLYAERHYWPATEEGEDQQRADIAELWVVYYEVLMDLQEAGL